MKKWTDMASLPQEFRDKIERLERNFAVSTVTFKKFEPIFRDIFRSPERILLSPSEEPPRAPKGRKQRWADRKMVWVSKNKSGKKWQEWQNLADILRAIWALLSLWFADWTNVLDC